MQKQSIGPLAGLLMAGGLLGGGYIGKGIYDRVTAEPDPIHDLWGKEIPYSANSSAQNKLRNMGRAYRVGDVMYHPEDELSPTRRIWDSLSQRAKDSMDVQHVFGSDKYLPPIDARKDVDYTIPGKLQDISRYRSSMNKKRLIRDYKKADKEEANYDSVKRWGAKL